VRGKALDVAALALCVDRVEGEARLAGAGEAGHADQRMAGQPDGDVLEVVLSRAVDDQLFLGHKHAILAGSVDANKRSLYRCGKPTKASPRGGRPSRHGPGCGGRTRWSWRGGFRP